MMKKLLKTTYILVKNYLIDFLGKRDKNVKEITKLGIVGRKNSQKAKNAELRSEN